MNTQDTQLLEELASIAEQYTVNAPKEVFRAFPNWGTELSVVLRNQTAQQIETALAGLESTDDASGKEKVAVNFARSIGPSGRRCKFSLASRSARSSAWP